MSVVGELTQESICRLADVYDPLDSLRETVGEWQLGTFGLSRRSPTFRKGYSGKLTDASRFRKQVFGPTAHGRSGVALIFRHFDSSPQQDHPSEYLVGWVPREREAQLDQWMDFMSAELLKRRRGEASPQTQATYSQGNAHAPFGIGQFVVELHLDDTVRLIHRRQETTRTWVARALPELWTALNVALGSSAFPTKPSVRVAPAGTDSFSLKVVRDGKELSVSGFGSPEYRDVNMLFGDIAAQMSGDQVIGFNLETATPYTADAQEVR
ncbi:MAG: hypothetical protein AB7T06_34785 [Kofleriaceae bacterium]